ncbi:hypothetical protein ACJVDH_13040 [Pedobacter sp. AW1-32]|uniref:hypothetical protein n=1 Tax=Pedobacter sp. AW1-32 TaxID=3383026 RepID=UPI003FF0DB8B
MNYRSLLMDDSASESEEQFKAEAEVSASPEKPATGSQTLRSGFTHQGEQKNYGFTILFEDDGQANEIKYELSVTCLGLNAESRSEFQIDRTSPVYINEVEPDLVADKLAYLAGKVFYPLRVETDSTGAFLSVTNVEEIRARWPKCRREIDANFEGDYASRYIGVMEDKLRDNDFIQLIFKEDWFIRVYFQSIYKNYNPANAETKNMHFPNLQIWMDGYQTEEIVLPEKNHFGALELHHNGELIPDEINMESGRYQAKYILDPVSHIIRMIVAEWTQVGKTEKKITFKLFTTDLDNAIKKLRKETEMANLIFLDGSESGTKRQGFWEKWF